MMRQPFAAAAFDVVICGLAIGHTADLAGWMAETARVLRPGGTLLYSDLHPEAARAGLTRSFTDETRHSYTLPHWRHELDVQRAAAAAAQLEIVTVAEARVGIELTETFAGSEAFYRRWHGLPLVVAVEARRR